jgi:hypothetical protein
VRRGGKVQKSLLFSPLEKNSCGLCDEHYRRHENYRATGIVTPLLLSS